MMVARSEARIEAFPRPGTRQRRALGPGSRMVGGGSTDGRRRWQDSV
jgi:hypothetical protein